MFPCVVDSTDPLGDIFGGLDCSPSGPGRSVFPLGLVVPGDNGIPKGLTNQYWRAFAPRLGVAWSPSSRQGWVHSLFGDPGRSSVRAGWGLFYDSNEELVVAQDSTGQPPFGGSTILFYPFLNTPFLGQNGDVSPNPFNGLANPKPGTPTDFALFRPISVYGSFPETLRNQYSAHYHLTVQRELPYEMLWQFGYVGSQGHRLLATVDKNYGNAQTCLDLNQIPGISCGPFGADFPYIVPAGAIPPGVTLHLPYGSVPSVTGPNSSPISLVGLRKYSSPFCEPATGTGCPPDGVPVFSSIFGIEPIANSSYSSFQTLVDKHFSHGLHFLVSYTWSKSLDNSSSFESSINPLDSRRSRSLSLFDARHRLVLSDYWEIPNPLRTGWTRHLTRGWATSGIFMVQTGFPVPITSSSDRELMSSFNFDTPGEPDMVKPFRRLNPRNSGGLYFDPATYAEAALGKIGNARRTICCGRGIFNLDLAIHKTFSLSEGQTFEFRTDVFNVFNHTQFFSPAGDITGGWTFGRVQRARDPRLLQFSMRLVF